MLCQSDSSDGEADSHLEPDIEEWEQAASDGNLERLRLLAGRHRNESEASAHRGKSLVLAASNGHVACVQWLLNEAGEIKERVNVCVRALHEAAEKGHVECLPWLVGEPGVRFSQRTSDGFNTLLLASRGGHVDCVQWLLQWGAHVNTMNYTGYTALHLAAGNGHLECVRLLLENHADVTPIALGESAVQRAASRGHVACVQYLIGEPGALPLPPPFPVDWSHDVRELLTHVQQAWEREWDFLFPPPHRQAVRGILMCSYQVVNVPSPVMELICSYFGWKHWVRRRPTPPRSPLAPGK